MTETFSNTIFIPLAIAGSRPRAGWLPALTKSYSNLHFLPVASWYSEEEEEERSHFGTILSSSVSLASLRNQYLTDMYAKTDWICYKTNITRLFLKGGNQLYIH